MKYEVRFKPRAIKDSKKIPTSDLRRILSQIEEMSKGLEGDVKRLTSFSPEYRLRVGDYRVLFEVLEDSIVIYRVRHRKDAYR